MTTINVIFIVCATLFVVTWVWPTTVVLAEVLREYFRSKKILAEKRQSNPNRPAMEKVLHSLEQHLCSAKMDSETRKQIEAERLKIISKLN